MTRFALGLLCGMAVTYLVLFAVRMGRTEDDCKMAITQLGDIGRGTMAAAVSIPTLDGRCVVTRDDGAQLTIVPAITDGLE